MVDTILVLCAHNDDQIVGAGGTLVKYASKGWKIRTVVFSYGEKSHPHIKKEEIVRTRTRAGNDSDKILGGSGIIWLDVGDGKLAKELKEKSVMEKLAEIVRAEKPTVILTHSRDDVHPDHRAVYKSVCELLSMNVVTCPVYTFDVWTPFGIAHAREPKLYVDISKTLTKKIEAFFVHRSQFITIFNLLWSIYIRALLNGRRARTKYAEVFYKVR